MTLNLEKTEVLEVTVEGVRVRLRLDEHGKPLMVECRRLARRRR